jgi:hypothetical protein
MTIAERLPKMNDAALANLKANAIRLQTTDGSRREAATLLLPLIEAEIAERESRVPPKPARPARRAASKVANTDAPAKPAKTRAGG